MSGRIARITYLLLVAAPLGLLLADAGRLALTHPGSLALALPAGRRWGLFISSVSLATGVSLIATALGFLGALALTSGALGRVRFLRWFPLVLAPLPPYVHALAWNQAITWLATVLPGDGPPPPGSGMAITFWVEVMALLPFAVALGLVAIRSLPRPAIEVARLHRADMAVLGGIVLPLAAPFLMSSVGLTFMLTLTNYEVPSLFAVTTYPLEIYAEFSASHDAARATILAMPILAISTMALVLLLPTLRQVSLRDSDGIEGIPWRWPPWLRVVLGAAVTALAAQLVVPAISLAARTSSWKAAAASVALARPELGFSLLVATAAAVLVLPLASAVAHHLRSAGWWLLAFAPLAVPAPLVGIALSRTFNSTLPLAVLDSPLLPVLAALIRFTPFATLVLLAGLRRRQAERIDAVRVFQPDPVAGWLKVRLHLEAPTLLAACGLVFALSLGELGATLLVTPPGRSTLAIRIYNYLHYGAAGSVRGLCLLMLGVTTLAGIGVAALVTRETRSTSS